MRVRAVRKIRFAAPLLAAAVLAGIASDPALGATSVSQHGITWTFDKDYPAGQFANGDWWVVGPVTIVSINPPCTTSDGRTINGSMINPSIRKTQGYDSATYGAYGPGYSASLNVALNMPLVVPVSSSLISSISHPTAGQRPQLTSAAILTVLGSAAPAGSFRPPYIGTDKTLPWNKNNLKYSILRSLAPVTGTPALSTVEGYFAKPWIEQDTQWTARYLHPSGNQPDYGRDMAHRLASGLLSLHLNYTPAQKETLFIRLVQYGIDVYGAAKGGGVWIDNGGHNMGRKMPLILAGLALDDAAILAYGNAANHFIFHEDRQTWYVRQSDVGRILYTGDGRPREQYIQSDVGKPEWGEQHTSQPNRDGRNWGAYYRDINNAASMGHALMGQLTIGAKSAWNWTAFFDYMDRAFPIDQGKSSGDLNTIQPFVKNMWNAYRSSVSSNTAPTLGNIADQSTAAGTPKTVPVVIGDAETAATALTVSAVSSNTALVPSANLVFGGSGANRTLTVSPAAGQTGTATITVTVSDGLAAATDAFILTVTPPPPPTVIIAPSGEKASEAPGNPGVWTITRTGGTTADLTVYFTVGGTASGSDVAAMSESALIQAGSSTASVTAAPLDDSLCEGAETVVLTLAARSTYAIGTQDSASITIEDNDPFQAASGLVLSPATPLTDEAVQASLATNAQSGGEVTYTWNFGDGTTGSGSSIPAHSYAAAGDYTVTVTAVHAPTGQTITAAALAHVTAPFGVTINFQPASAAVPAGCLADTGSVFGDRANGHAYGWNADNHSNCRDRNAPNSLDQRYDTLNHMQKAPNPDASWEIAVPNGTYSVRLVAGDPSYNDSIYRISAEGILAVDGTPSSTVRWIEGAATVTVADGRLTIRNAAGSRNNKICFVEIGAVGAASRDATLRDSAMQPLVLSLLQLKAAFNKTGRDSCRVQGKLPSLPKDFKTDGVSLWVDVGAAIHEFPLDAQGRGKTAQGACSLRFDPARGWTFDARWTGNLWAERWADGGLDNANVKRLPVEMPVTVTVDGHIFGGGKMVQYVARRGKTGAAK